MSYFEVRMVLDVFTLWLSVLGEWVKMAAQLEDVMGSDDVIPLS